MANVTLEEKKAEAVKRLKTIGLFKPAVEQFRKQNLVNISEPPLGGLYWLDDEEQQMVKDFEEKNNALVYHVIRSFTEIGTLDSLFFVSDYKEEWDQDNEDLKDGYALVYVVNHQDEWCSEFGTIGFQLLISGGLRRTA